MPQNPVEDFILVQRVLQSGALLLFLLLASWSAVCLFMQAVPLLLATVHVSGVEGSLVLEA